MASVFTKIVSGEISSYKIAETADCYAFLDINPLAKGHIIVIPKKETDYIFDIEQTEYSRLMQFAKEVAAALKLSVPCKKVGVAVVGLEVPHAHIHLIPINQVSDMSFSNPKLKLEKEEMEEIAEKIRKNFR